ncbi:unnamed protein product [Rangifer tarandus platyrhynchus]|uniref:Uncharacterized protein n=2 Tax=Rangifer tarandus platyrhynchus TaxID=3082113 RepID=A0AC59ZSI9_RANTA|nr:unnamed protein product [Rangifer tarandus platyrhynchus]
MIFIYYLFVAALGLQCCAGFSLVVASGGCSLDAVLELLVEVASLVAERRLWSVGLGSCGARPQLLRSRWDLPRQGIEPMSPALAVNSLPLSHQGSPNFFLFTEV